MKNLVMAGVIGLLATGISTHSFAQEQKGWNYTVGVMGNVSNDYLGSDDTDSYFFPLFDATYQIDENSQFNLGMLNGFGYEASVGNFSYGLGLGYRSGLFGSAFDNDDDVPELLRGMEEHEDSFTVNTKVAYHHDNLELAMHLEKGFHDTNKGWTVTPAISYEMPITEQLMANFSLHATYGNDRFVDDYFGVSANEVNSMRSEFKGEAGFYEYGASTELMYFIDKNQMIMASLAATRFTGDVASSSLVQKKVQTSVSLGYLYFF